MDKIIILIIEPLYTFICGLVSYIVPTKKNYYVFYPKIFKGKFAGNVKAFILYLSELHKEIETVTLSFENNGIQEGKTHGLKTKKSLFGVLWVSLQAEHIFIDRSSSGEFSRGRFSLQLITTNVELFQD